MFELLENLNRRPEPFSASTTRELWTDEHTARQMLAYHLDPTLDAASRNHAFIDRSAQWIAERFALGAGRTVVDFGCGPGLYTQRLAHTGATVTGLDFSANSLAYARQAAAQAGLAINYLHTDYLHFETAERFDLILLIYCDFCPLGPAQRHALLQRFQALLRPGGSLLLDVCSLAGFARKKEQVHYEPQPSGGFWSPHPYHVFQHTFTYPTEQVSLDQYTIIEAQRTRTVYNWLQHFTPTQLADEFAAAGLAVQELLGGVAGGVYDETAAEFAVIARRS